MHQGEVGFCSRLILAGTRYSLFVFVRAQEEGTMLRGTFVWSFIGSLI